MQIGKFKTKEHFYSQMQRLNNEITSTKEPVHRSIYDKYIQSKYTEYNDQLDKEANKSHLNQSIYSSPKKANNDKAIRHSVLADIPNINIDENNRSNNSSLISSLRALENKNEKFKFNKSNEDHKVGNNFPFYQEANSKVNITFNKRDKTSRSKDKYKSFLKDIFKPVVEKAVDKVNSPTSHRIYHKPNNRFNKLIDVGANPKETRLIRKYQDLNANTNYYFPKGLNGLSEKYLNDMEYKERTNKHFLEKGQ